MGNITNNKNLKYIAIIPFAILILCEIAKLGSFYGGKLIATIVFIAGFACVIAGLLISKSIVSSAGFALIALTAVLGSLEWIMWYIGPVREAFMYGETVFFFSCTFMFIAILLNIATYALLAVACAKPAITKKLGQIAAIASIAATVAVVISRLIYNLGIGYPFDMLTWGILNAAGAITLTSAYDSSFGDSVNAQKTNTVHATASAPAEQAAAVKSDAEKLIKLKQLLEAGIITQEDFDEKKKQLLDL